MKLIQKLYGMSQALWNIISTMSNWENSMSQKRLICLINNNKKSCRLYGNFNVYNTFLYEETLFRWDVSLKDCVYLVEKNILHYNSNFEKYIEVQRSLSR